MTFEPRNLLITGGAGFIGANFVRHWLTKRADGRVVVFDALTYAGNAENLAGLAADRRYHFVKGDICDEAAVRVLLQQYQIDTVVNFAAESHVDRSILGPDDFIRTNVVGTHSLLKAVKSLWIDKHSVPAHRFHHVSTDEVYGTLGPTDAAFDEASRYAPNSPYSASKASSDHLVRAYHKTYGLDTTVSNCSNNYGPYQFPEKLVPLTIVNILMGEPLPIYGDGLQRRDWLHVEDHCVAIAMALKHGRSGEVYNIGGNSETTNIEVVRTLCALIDRSFVDRADLHSMFPAAPAVLAKRSVDLITHVRDRQGHDRRYAINYEKAKAELGYMPARVLERGLRETVDWYLANTRWWQALLGRDYADWLKKNYQR
jgi:dTDP-glucose 4,6-dehydratase